MKTRLWEVERAESRKPSYGQADRQKCQLHFVCVCVRGKWEQSGLQTAEGVCPVGMRAANTNPTKQLDDKRALVSIPRNRWAGRPINRRIQWVSLIEGELLTELPKKH